MSKTEVSADDESAVRNGPHSRPGSAGSLRRSKGSRREVVAHPGPAARPGEDRLAVLGVAAAGLEGQVDHQVGHRLGRQDRPRTGRRAGRRRWPTTPGGRAAGPPVAPIDTSAKSAVPAPAQVEAGPVGAPGHQLQGALGLGVGQAEAGGDAQVRSWSTVLGEPGQDVVGGPWPGRRRRTARSARRTVPTGRCGPGVRRTVVRRRPATPLPAGWISGLTSSAGGDPAASARPPGPARPRRRRPPRRATPTADPAADVPHADDGDPPVAPAAVGGGRVVGESHLDLTGVLDQHHAVVAARRGRSQRLVRPRPGPAGGRRRSSPRLLAGVEDPDAADQHRRAAVARPGRPGRAGPCRS